MAISKHAKRLFQKRLIYLSCLIFLACQKDVPSSEPAEIAPLTPLQEEYSEAKQKWGFIDLTGAVTIEGNYDEVNNFSEGLAAYRDKAAWGYINSKGEKVIKAKFYNAFNFKNGTAKVSDFERKYGVIKSNGNLLIPCNYEDLGDFTNERCAAKQNGKWGYIDSGGQWIIPNKYESAKNFVDNVAIVKQDEKSFLIDRKGQKISDAFDKINALYNGMYKVKFKNKYGIINSRGEIEIKPDFNRISQVDKEVFAVRQGEEHFLRSFQKDKIAVPENTDIKYLGSNRWSYEKNGKIGMIDNDGKIVLQPRYNIITPFADGFASYQRDQLWGYLDTEGKILTPPLFGLTWEFKEGLARVISREGVGFINKEGRLEFTANDFDVRDFHEGLARMPIK